MAVVGCRNNHPGWPMGSSVPARSVDRVRSCSDRIPSAVAGRILVAPGRTEVVDSCTAEEEVQVLGAVELAEGTMEGSQRGVRRMVAGSQVGSCPGVEEAAVVEGAAAGTEAADIGLEVEPVGRAHRGKDRSEAER